MSDFKKETNEDFDRVKKAVADLGEHFDSVQIFVTKCNSDEEGTLRIAYGSGNWFTRYGQVTAWKTAQDECERQAQRPN